MRIIFKESYALLWMIYLSGVDSSSIPMVRRTDTILEAVGGEEREYSRTNGVGENTYAPINGDEDPNMFTIPRILKNNDKIKIVGTLKTNPQNFTLSITSGKREEVPCIINVNFSKSITFEMIINGSRENVSMGENKATQDYFREDAEKFEFSLLYLNDGLKITVENIHLHFFPLEHDANDLKYIELSGDVKKVDLLSFSFA